MAADHHAVDHDYHLVNPSPWPAFGALSAFVLAFGTVWYLHPDMMGDVSIGLAGTIVGLIMVILTMIFWWRDVIKEARHGDHKPVVQLGLRYGMALFIASEVMFFAAFFWAYFDASIFASDPIQFMRVAANGGQWPPTHIETLDAFHLPLMNTMILLLSGCTVTWAHHALREGNRKGLIQGLIFTVILGISFTCVQVYEYGHATFGFTEGIYSSTFYMATGFHGFH
ncbi:MAG: cytochrome c oxidase subunit 3, partial [Alphaproteobacteria bacterium]|nr:cytochrome c oxidase subunit 3 [Alphaproteobacteria bacterium]